MRDTMTHRGPDDAGSFLAQGVGLGHRRLSIIDLSPGGHQPMSTEDGQLTLVFNGEIYNYLELRRELEAKGVVFHSHSDTEVILRLHAQVGDAAVERLNGIFAYALYEARSGRTLLARDRAGIKPLYYSATAQGVAFASEIKALFASGLITPRLNESAVGEHLLYRQVAGPRNLFDGVLSLPAGHTLEIKQGEAGSPNPFWSASHMPPVFNGTYADAVEALDEVLNAAVRRQMVADVPLGTFCSGGIDSSLVTAFASRLASRPINTFSVGFAEAEYDESAYARAAATACGTVHHELRVSEEEYASQLPSLAYFHDLPLNFANSVHIYAVSALARRHVTVALTGEGADELFGGYPRYYLPRLLGPAQLLPPVLLRALGKLGKTLPERRIRRMATSAAMPVEDLLIYNCSNIAPEFAVSLLHGNQPDLQFRRRLVHAALQDGHDAVSALGLLDFQTYLASILNRQDKMSMAASLEARVPFLDNEVIDFARSLPLAFRQTLRRRKRVLQDVALRYLPRQIIYRKKSGFGVPLGPWFKGKGPMSHLLDDVLHDQGITSLLDMKVITDLIRRHRAGHEDHAEILWSVLSLGIWRRRFGV